MAFYAAPLGGLPPRRWFDTAVLGLAAVAVSLGAAAWISNSDQTAFASAALPQAGEEILFQDRFLQASTPARMPRNIGPMSPDRSAFEIDEIKLQAAKALLSRRLLSQDWPADLSDQPPRADEPKPMLTASIPASIPLPRPRPAAAVLEATPRLASTSAQDSARPDGRTLLQKLSDLLPGRMQLASLAPNGGLFGRGPDLASLGFDGFTAVYDISARAVYLPNGTILEAHSGMGNLRDDPEHVSVPNAGATPPAVYDLRLREKLFHGVQALRMTPVEGSDVSGRSGLLAHSFMLGPNGDSNGCISIRDYDRFLKAFNDGEINRVIVVPSLSSIKLASQSATPS
jgi:type VI secretion system (T6SS) effector TldE1-like protein